MDNDFMSASPTEMIQKAEEINSYGENFDSLTKELKKAIDFLCTGSWAGASSDAFLEQYDELKPGFENTLELIYGISGQLKEIANILESTNSDIAQALRR